MAIFYHFNYSYLFVLIILTIIPPLIAVPSNFGSAIKSAYLWWKGKNFEHDPTGNYKDVLLDEYYMEYLLTKSEERAKVIRFKIAIHVHFYIIRWKIHQHREHLANLTAQLMEDDAPPIQDVQEHMMRQFKRIMKNGIDSPDNRSLCYLLKLKHELLKSVAFPNKFNEKMPFCDSDQNSPVNVESVLERLDQIQELLLSDLWHLLPTRKKMIKYLGGVTNKNEVENIRLKFIHLFGFSRLTMLCEKYFELAFLVPQLRGPEFFVLSYQEFFKLNIKEGKWRAKLVLAKFLYDEWANRFYNSEMGKINDELLNDPASLGILLTQKKRFIKLLMHHWVSMEERFWDHTQILLGGLEQMMRTTGGGKFSKMFEMAEGIRANVEEGKVGKKEQKKITSGYHDHDHSNNSKVIKEVVMMWEDGPRDTAVLRAFSICMEFAVGEYNKRIKGMARMAMISVESVVNLQTKAELKMVQCIGKNVGKTGRDEKAAEMHLAKLKELVEMERNGHGTELGEQQFEEELRKNMNKWNELISLNGVNKLRELLKEEYFSAPENFDSSEEYKFIGVGENEEIIVINNKMEQKIEEIKGEENKEIQTEKNDEYEIYVKKLAKAKRIQNKKHDKTEKRLYKKSYRKYCEKKKMDNKDIENEEIIANNERKSDEIESLINSKMIKLSKNDKPSELKNMEKDECKIIIKDLRIMKTLKDLSNDFILATLYKIYFERKLDEKCVGYLHILAFVRTIQAKMEMIRRHCSNLCQQEKFENLVQKWNEFLGFQIDLIDDLQFVMDKLFFVQALLEGSNNKFLGLNIDKILEIFASSKLQRIGKFADVNSQEKSQKMERVSQFGHYKIEYFNNVLRQLHLHIISLERAKNGEIFPLKNEINTSENCRNILIMNPDGNWKDDYAKSMKIMLKQQNLDKKLNSEIEHAEPVDYEISQYNLIKTNVKYRKGDSILSEEIINFVRTHTMGLKKQEEIKHFIGRIRIIASIWVLNIAVNKGQKYLGPKILVSGSHLTKSALATSDLDLICLVPDYINVYHFYGAEDDDSLFSMIIKELLNGEKDKIKWMPGRVSMLRIEYGQIETDLLFVPIPTKYLDKNINLEIDDKLIGELKYEAGIYALSGYRSALYQLSLVPPESLSNLNFFSLLMALKIWAKNRLIYSGIFGYFNGASLTVMATKICALFPNAPLIYLLQQFFAIFSKWNWSRVPLFLDVKTEESLNNIVKRYWPPPIVGQPMSIITPKFPEQNATFNVNKFTIKTIVEELNYANNLLTENPENWQNLFEEINYAQKFKLFAVIICASEESEKCGFQKTKIRWKLIEWAQQESVAKKVEHYHTIPSYEKREKCTILSHNSTCTQWLVGLKLKEKCVKENCGLISIYPPVDKSSNPSFILHSFFTDADGLIKRMEI